MTNGPCDRLVVAKPCYAVDVLFGVDAIADEGLTMVESQERTFSTLEAMRKAQDDCSHHPAENPTLSHLLQFKAS
jgi:hypothetical protein